jgi:hypothetical protein
MPKVTENQNADDTTIPDPPSIDSETDTCQTNKDELLLT